MRYLSEFIQVICCFAVLKFWEKGDVCQSSQKTVMEHDYLIVLGEDHIEFR